MQEEIEHLAKIKGILKFGIRDIPAVIDSGNITLPRKDARVAAEIAIALVENLESG